MKWTVTFLVLLLGTAGCQPAAGDSGVKFYLQLIQAVNTNLPPQQDSRPIGPKLRTKLQCAFKWTNYWEIKRNTVTVPRGRKVRDVLSPEQSVEIELLDRENVAVRVYSNGQLVRSRRQPSANAFFVTGAPVGEDQSWFIVVRRDEPQPGETR